MEALSGGAAGTDLARMLTTACVRCVALVMAMGASPACAREDSNPPPPVPLSVPASTSVAFTNVHLVDVEAGHTIANQTLVVVGGRIAGIGAAGSVGVPPGATVIDGAGTLFLAPGLVDMHEHVLDDRDFWLLLANGITTVRNLHGTPGHLAWRRQLADGTRDGPRLITSGPIIDGSPPMRPTNVVVTTDAEARREVQRQLDAGYDLVKVYDNLGDEAYRAIVEAATSRGALVTGHVPTPIGLAGVLRSPHQAMIEHTEELLPAFGPSLTSARPDEVAASIAAAGIAVVPTLVVYKGAVDMAVDWPALQRRREAAWVSGDVKAMFQWDAVAQERRQPGAAAFFATRLRFMQQQLVPALRRAGVTILAGADAPVAPLVPGWSFLDELDLLAGAGMTPAEVLAAASGTAARVLGRTREFGSLAIGTSADLVVLRADPLRSLSALRDPVGTMARGAWYARTRLLAIADSAYRHGA